MITVIIAGGSGTRLWPLSTHKYPKHLLKLTGDRSSLQATYDRGSKLGGRVYVVTESGHAHHIKEQLPELSDDNFIIEPGRRGTANCIIAALDHVAKRHDHDEAIVFLSADHHIRDVGGFVQSFSVAAEHSNKAGKITLVGVEPTYPSTGFGYIHKGKFVDGDFVSEVSAFKEKPDFETAKAYTSSGDYLWNCGYFVGSVNTFLSAMKAYSPDLADNFEKLSISNESNYDDTYLAFESDAIDYALIEKTPDLLVVPASFDWMDLGSFKDLHEANESDQAGNHMSGKNIYSAEVENAYIRNEEEKPVAVIGLDNVVVVNTPNGILVARKDLSQKVGDIAKKIQSE